MVKPSVDFVIWDWNGTLLNDPQICYAIVNEMLRSRQLPLLADLEEYRRYFTFPVIDFYRRAGFHFTSENFGELADEFACAFGSRVSACPLRNHAKETIAAIHQCGIRQILLSATREDRLLKQIKQHDLHNSFDQILGLKDGFAHGKSAQAASFAARAQVIPDRVVMIGDTDHDWQIATELGCQCILLDCGHQTPEHLRSLAVPLVSTLPDVLSILGIS